MIKRTMSILILLGLVFAVSFAFADNSSEQGSRGVIPTQPFFSELDEGPVAVFEDNLPWGQTANYDAMDNLGIAYDIYNSLSMDEVDLSVYCMVLISSQQDDNFYTNWNNNLWRFTDFVEAGGVLEFHGAHYFNVTTIWGLPGGVAYNQGTGYESTNNWIADAGHPINAGLIDPFTNNYASHGSFTQYPNGTDIVDIDDFDMPTTIDYAWGDGRVIATLMTWEWAYGGGAPYAQILPNAISYANESCQGCPLRLIMTPHPPFPTIPPAGGIFTFDAMIQNTSANMVTYDAWTHAILPNTNYYGPVNMVTGLTIGPFATVNYTGITVFVPFFAPPGVYVFCGNLGTYPDACVTDCFDFEKVALGAEGDLVEDWGVAGWDADAATVTTDDPLPLEYSIAQVYPNPFNPSTNVTISMPFESNLSVKVFDVNGRQVASLADGRYAAGYHTVMFNAEGLSSGIYFVRATVPGRFNEMRKVVLVK